MVIQSQDGIRKNESISNTRANTRNKRGEAGARQLKIGSYMSVASASEKQASVRMAKGGKNRDETRLF